ncbi:T9SS type A sorting domain-containing protein [Hymenobacter cellulosivorans]|uniref:T9SS type A sorting domain-containing protein n=1 Tax=Hymenobacter cellulosivorans TaxID=2932249 RepID=A0ABY4F2M4_9BACT|nr:T9SS type A sorting domain-containing protein [Hymenobacter cellulosivorans]UOQ50918.1 T9SS type A sorting domain-containing protein [Hymenobacter cellulosivorans]
MPKLSVYGSLLLISRIEFIMAVLSYPFLQAHQRLLLALFLFVYHPTSAQKEATTWYFGNKAGFDFSTGHPLPLATSAMLTGYTTAVVSDGTTEEVQFYTNGEQVWNRRHQRMAHGDSMLGFRNFSQGALILPVPGQAHQYYLFNLVPTSGLGTTLTYSRVDMLLAAGLGDVVPEEKGRILTGQFTQQLTGIRHANGVDYWVVVHEWPGNQFRVYRVDALGVVLARTQAIGPQLPATAQQQDIEGTLRASPNGRYLAYASAGRVPLSLFDFDPATGDISHFISLGQLLGGGGISFSPDNTKLYAQDYRLSQLTMGTRNILLQFDLQAGDDAAVVASGLSIVVGNPTTNISAQQQDVAGYYALQLGSDGRLYGASQYQDETPSAPRGDNLYVIQYPNRRGYACAVFYQTIDFRPGALGPGLPNFPQHYFNGLESVADAGSACADAQIALFPNPTTGAFRIQVTEGCTDTYHMTLYDVLGRRVLVKTLKEADRTEQINITPLASGVYSIILDSSSNRRITHKLVKY